jgi:hypothetical protein
MRASRVSGGNKFGFVTMSRPDSVAGYARTKQNDDLRLEKRLMGAV